MSAVMPIYMDPRLKELAGQAADAENLPLSEFIVRALAEKLGRPDLAVIPRKKSGRPRKAMVLPHTNGNGHAN